MPLPTADEYVASLLARNPCEVCAGDGSVAPRTIPSVAIVGAGTMGVSIAAANVRCGIPVVLVDPDPGAQTSATRRVAEELAEGPQPVDRLLAVAADLGAARSCELVIESIPENLAAKQSLYAQIEPHLARGTVLGTNTSTIPIAQLAGALADPGRFCGLHFFHPVRRRVLVEVVRGPQSRADTIAAAVAYAKQIGQTPIVVDDGPGFLVNRLLVPYLTEAVELLMDGARIDDVERSATEFGMEWGPLRALDEIGLDTALMAGRVLWQAFPDRVAASPLLITMYKAGRLGRKAGKGFFAYPAGLPLDAPGRADPAVEPMIATWARTPLRPSPEAITARLLLAMVLEASRVLGEGRVRDARDVDLGVLLGLGFPRSRGGLLYWADTLGPRRLLAMLEPWAGLGERFRPTPMLKRMAAEDRRFGDRSGEF